MKRMYIAGKVYIIITKNELHRAFKSVDTFSDFMNKAVKCANGEQFKFLLERGDNEKR